VRRVQDRADQLTRLAHLRSPVARRVRDAALGALSVLGGRRSADQNSRLLQQEEPAALRSAVAGLVPHRQG